MNAWTLPIDAGVVHTLSWVLIHFLWQGLAIGAIYALVRRALAGASAEARYVSGMCAMVLLALMPLLTWFWLRGGVAAAGGDSLTVELPSLRVDGSGSHASSWSLWLSVLWGIGVGAMSARALAQVWNLRRLTRGAEPLPEWDAKVIALCRELGVTRPVRLLRSALIETPCLVGWWAPVILLPVGVMAGMNPAQIELIVAHELAHVRRWDYLANLLQIAIETVLFYHPVVHWISADVRQEREACCDADVLALGGDPIVYARTLVSLEELRLPQAPAVAITGGVLMNRVRRIVGLPAQPATPILAGHWLAIVGAIVVLAAGLRAEASPAPKLPAATAPAMKIEAPRAASAASLAIEPDRVPTPRPTATAPVLPEAEPAPATDEVVVREAAPRLPSRIALARDARPRAALALNDVSIARSALEAPQIDAPETVESELRVLWQTMPKFPEEAAVLGRDGHVVLSFRVDNLGIARGIKVVSYEGQREFADAAIVALRQWRFDPASRDDAVEYRQSFDFSFGDAVGMKHDCNPITGTHLCRG